MPRYKATVEYLGASYAGWQKQLNAITIQAVIEDAIFKFSGETVNVFGSGRTDSGVHAYGQVAHFDLSKQYLANEVFKAVNFYLKDTGIAFIHVEIVDENFHARFSATHRHYVYKIINRKAQLAIEQNTALWVIKTLDVAAMQIGAKCLVGSHDFSSFRSSECLAKSATKTLTKIDIIKTGEKIEFYVSAVSFLHHMVRNIVGTLLLVGSGKIASDKIEHILKSKSRSSAGPTAPAHGLYLLKVDY
jgi:tRNA pseudouridine38-40 synthase